MEAYCVKCRKKTTMEGAKAVLMKNKRQAVQGKCTECGTKMFKMGQP